MSDSASNHSKPLENVSSVSGDTPKTRHSKSSTVSRQSGSCVGKVGSGPTQRSYAGEKNRAPSKRARTLREALQAAVDAYCDVMDLGILKFVQRFQQALAAQSHASPTEPADAARRYFLAVGQGHDGDAAQLLETLVLHSIAQALQADSRLLLALQIAEGGPFRWRRGVELAARMLADGAATRKERAQ